MKRAYLFLAVVLLLFFIVGCNPKSIETRSITFYTDGALSKHKELLDKAKVLFEDKHPGVTVNYHFFSGNTFTSAAYKKGIDDLIQEGKSPDIVVGNSSFISSLGKQDYLHDINILVKRNGIRLDDYFERPMLDNLTHNQKLLAIPDMVIPLVIFYNKLIFKNAGVPEPTKEWTWYDLADATQKIQKQNSGQVTTVFPYLNTTTLALSNGGSFISPDGSTYRGYLDGKPSVEAISWYASKVRENLFNPSPTQDPMKLLQSGAIGMYISYFSSLSSILPENKDHIGIALLPSFPNKSRTVFGSSGGMGILQKSKHPDLALEFIKFISMDKNEISSELSLNSGIGLSKKVTESLEQDPYLKIKYDSIPYIKGDLHQINANFLDAQIMFRNGLENIVLKGTDFQKELSDLAQLMDDELRKSEQK